MSNETQNKKYYIAAGTQLEGKLTTDQNIVIDGTIIGSVEGQKEVFFEKKGSAEGPVKAKIIKVKGKIKGDLFSNGKVEILSGGILEGNVSTPPGGIVVRSGGILNSHLSHYKSAPEPLDPLEIKK